MWEVALIVMCSIMGECQELSKQAEEYRQAPAWTEEACYIVAYDKIFEAGRRKGIHAPFEIWCEWRNMA